jgi:ribonucleotide monophosphatase NagD (HAD superfamily)
MNIISYYLPSFLIKTIPFINLPHNNQLLKKPNINDIKNSKLILLNMDGVLCIGNKPIIIAKETFNYFREKNKDNQICIITNDCMRTPKKIKKDLTIMGYNMLNIKIISASSIILEYIRDIIFKNDARKPLNISLVVEENIFFYIKDNIKKEYNNVNFYWIFDKKQHNKNNQKIDYFIIGSINNDKSYKSNIMKNNLISSIKNNIIDATFIILYSNNNNIDNNNKKKDTLSPSYIINLINNELNLNIKPYCPNKYNIKLIKNQIKSLCILDNEKIKKKEILIIGNNIDIDMDIDMNIALYEHLQIKKGVVLTGSTNNYNLSYKSKKQLDNLDYIVPDLSYFFC